MSLRWLSFFLLLLFLPAGPAVSNQTGYPDGRTIVVLGDSLTAGYGLPQADAFPSQLEESLKANGIKTRVVNSGVSGDTSAGGLSRIDWALTDKPDLVIVALGANDALRGLDPEETKKNLAATLEKILSRDTRVLLAGMKAPRNMGPDYYSKFDPLYAELAEQYKVSLYPFFLEGVATDPALNQADGIHPNRDGVAVMVRNILPYVEKLLEE